MLKENTVVSTFFSSFGMNKSVQLSIIKPISFSNHLMKMSVSYIVNCAVALPL